MKTRASFAVLLLFLLVALRPESAHAIPQWARQYDVSCNQCHSHPPKLNRFGGEFLANNYQWPDTTRRPQSRRTLPLAVWASGRSDSPLSGAEQDAVRAYINRLEIISGGRAVVPWLAYFVEWRPVSLEGRNDGSLRDRSGRFEDIFLNAQGRQLEVTAGQFRQVQQVDVSRRLGISEPLVLSGGLPGSDRGLIRDAEGRLSAADARILSLRGFSPSGRSPAVRVGWNSELSAGLRWSSAVALPIPGEFSIPLTREARTEASNEFEVNPKGVFAESFVRRGPATLGGHVFYDHSDRYIANAVTTGNRAALHWTAMGGMAKSRGALTGRWSLEGEYIPSYFLALGGRVEDRAGDGAEPAFLPYINAHFPGTKSTIRLTVERRFQQGRNGTFIELGTIF